MLALKQVMVESTDLIHVNVEAANKLKCNHLTVLQKVIVTPKQEAGRKLRQNHGRVLLDLCNPSGRSNIDGKMLTQVRRSVSIL